MLIRVYKQQDRILVNGSRSYHYLDEKSIVSYAGDYGARADTMILVAVN